MDFPLPPEIAILFSAKGYHLGKKSDIMVFSKEAVFLAHLRNDTKPEAQRCPQESYII